MLNPNITAFVSDVDIMGGQDVQEKIIERIIECDKLVLCFTKENKQSPWLLFEAGYARGVRKIVVPLLFDEDPYWHSWIDNPMNISREINFARSDFDMLFFKCFDIQDTKSNQIIFEEYKKSIVKIKEDYRVIDIHCEDFINKLLSNATFTLENPIFREKKTHFLTGFESFDLYKEVTEAFLYTGKHLWIYGRRNTKLFGGNFRGFFTYLKGKASKNQLKNHGIDFRCLFLDPASDEVTLAHPHQDIFKQDLETTIAKAKYEIGNNQEFKSCFRLYKNKREDIIIRLDNIIILSRPSFDVDGRPHLLTDTGFEVFSVLSEQGQEYVEKFNYVWEHASEIE